MKKLWIILLILVAIAIGVGVYWYLNQEDKDSTTTEESTAVELEEESTAEEDGIIIMEAEEVEEITEETHGLVTFEEIALDTMMLGKWQHATDTGWYRIYTMEPAGDD